MMNRMLIIAIGFISTLVGLSSCSSNTKPDLILGAASNMQFVLPDLLVEFESQTGKKCTVIYGSSGKLFSQISAGAPVDIFFSADTIFPKQLESNKLTIGSKHLFALGQLALWSNEPISKSLGEFLKSKPSGSHWAMANPQIAPYGQATQECISNLDMLEILKRSMVLGESVSQVNQFIYSKSVSFGFTSKSSVIAQNISPEFWLEVPDSLYQNIQQTAVILKKSNEIELAHEFIVYLKSNTAQEILKRNGYKSIK